MACCYCIGRWNVAIVFIDKTEMTTRDELYGDLAQQMEETERWREGVCVWRDRQSSCVDATHTKWHSIHVCVCFLTSKGLLWHNGLKIPTVYKWVGLNISGPCELHNSPSAITGSTGLDDTLSAFVLKHRCLYSSYTLNPGERRGETKQFTSMFP